ncbi:post-transcriptional regulator [Thermaerobacillus caldiproteolyticus]|uniref:Uncharacterized protein n=1 Tax=Thermaerobacillus caldiproteolyticus TaxID=247480 RepID=A0A7V9Z3Z5_9BACL|nr:post-transcriptional regulator [Anoxybacillus caldiproteolyticus]MBA2873622.1 hypothetical protein [Anoxybacillus caldiproteolyticus]QPA30202.1 transcriptional regulator [Anoxybacillus caldiproteolyticus]
MDKEKIEELREQLMPVLECKYDEFRLLGYEQVEIEQIWECLFYKKWKKLNEKKKLFELVEDILSLRIGDYMAFLTMKTYQQQRSADGNDLEVALKELL